MRFSGFLRYSLILLFWLVVGYFLKKHFEELPAPVDLFRLILELGASSGVAYFSVFFVAAFVVRVARFHFSVRSIKAVPLQESATCFAWTFFLGAVSPFRVGESARLNLGQ